MKISDIVESKFLAKVESCNHGHKVEKTGSNGLQLWECARLGIRLDSPAEKLNCIQNCNLHRPKS